MISDRCDEALRDMPSGTHAVLLYDTLEHKRDVLLSHLKHGVGKEGLVYAYYGEQPEAVKQLMDERGMSPEYLTMRGQLTITPAEGVYVKGGRVDIDSIYRGFSELAWSYRVRGLEGIRASADLSPLIQKGLTREMQMYEESLGRKFAFPGKGICAFDLVQLGSTGYISQMLPIFMAHSMVIMTGPNGDVVISPERVREAGIENTLKVINPRWRADGLASRSWTS